MTKHIPFLAAALISLWLTGCQTGVVTDPQQIVFPDTNVRYSRHVQPLFDLSCAVGGCHDAGTQAGGLSLASYIDILERPGVVVPGDSAGSVLVQVLNRRVAHNAYPVDRLTNENHRRGIALWVQEGAHNN